MDDEPENETESCFTLGLELARNLFAKGKLDSRGGTRGFRSTAGAGPDTGASDIGLEVDISAGAVGGGSAIGIEADRPGVAVPWAVLNE